MFAVVVRRFILFFLNFFNFSHVCKPYKTFITLPACRRCRRNLFISMQFVDRFFWLSTSDFVDFYFTSACFLMLFTALLRMLCYDFQLSMSSSFTGFSIFSSKLFIRFLSHSSTDLYWCIDYLYFHTCWLIMHNVYWFCSCEDIRQFEWQRLYFSMCCLFWHGW